MRKALASSVVRAVLLGAILSAISAGPACSHQTFDLLQDATAGARAGTPNAGATSSAGGSVAGDPGHDSGGDASSGRGGASSFSGSTGGIAMDAAGSPSLGPCVRGEQCVPGGRVCPPSESSCVRCTTNADCEGLQADLCSVPDGRCAECLLDGDPALVGCRSGEVCHPLTLRCMHFCKSNADCVNENQKPFCDAFSACVACLDANDCRQLTGHNGECAFGTCIECYDNRQCPVDQPNCVDLHCRR